MLVVADSSPINILVRIECVKVLPRLFGGVLVPPEVAAELAHPQTPDSVRRFIASPPSWLEVRAATLIERIPPLDRGEEAAISLAREVHADALLIDERDGRKAALIRGVAIIGTIGLLEKAATQQLVDLGEVMDRLRQSDFRIDPRLVHDALRRYELRSPPGDGAIES